MLVVLFVSPRWRKKREKDREFVWDRNEEKASHTYRDESPNV